VTPYPLLLSPLTVGPVTLRNRVAMGAHFTMFTEPTAAGEPGFYGERTGRYLGDRARGGVGAVICGQAAVHPTTAYQMPNNAAAWKPESVDHFRRVTDQVHEHEAAAFLQLAHNGGVNRGNWSKLPVVGPSVISDYDEPAVALTEAGIAQMIEAFAVSAGNAAAGGFDGIEVHGAHGYLIHEFLSPRTNLRDDRWGGSLENRMRFGGEVLRAVRAAVGSGVAVGLRLVGDEEQWDGSGLTADDAAEIAAGYEADGLVDFVHVSVGTSGMGMVRTNYARPGLGVTAASTVRAALSGTPVFAVHRILDPDQAEAILADGGADGICLVRALIADPDWVAKAAAGRAAEIRRCTGSNQSCYGNLVNGMPVSCVQNPAVGREAELGAGTLGTAAVAKKVVVVGGGPAGLEAAWVAAARGHQVVLFEAADELGGAIRLAAALPGRGEMAAVADWRAGECERRGVDVRLGVRADVETVLAESPDAVIVATGGRADKGVKAKYHPTPVPGYEQDFVIDHVDALRRTLAGELRGRVVVLDAVGHIEAIGLGELLATQGVDVTVVTALAAPISLDPETQQAALPRAVRAGMTWRPNTVLGAIGDHEVTLVDALSHAIDQVVVDWVVIRTHGRPENTLVAELEGQVSEVVAVGDAVAVRPADRAVWDGHQAARAL
jgi:2,4-dienoyl-CoA reductase-like NADH-dependent reductase (Old Yellow Enzyme family)/thioredoxin reductase